MAAVAELDYVALVHTRIQLHDSTPVETESKEMMDPHALRRLAAQREYYTHCIEGLRLMYNHYLSDPSNELSKKTLRFMYENMPGAPLSDLKILKYLKTNKAFTSLKDAIQHYDDSYLIMRCEHTYVVCKTQVDYEFFVDDMIGHRMYEILLLNTVQKLTFITSYTTREDLEYLKVRLATYVFERLGKACTSHDIVIGPYDGQMFVVVKTVQDTYAHNRDFLRDFLDQNMDMKRSIVVMDPVWQHEINDRILELPLIAKVFKPPHQLKTDIPVVMGDKANPASVVYNITNINVTGNHFVQNINRKPSKKKIARAWISKNPPAGIVVPKYYEDYIRGIAHLDTDGMGKNVFNDFVRTLGYEKKKRTSQGGKWYWVLASDSDSGAEGDA
jgi:hypothetical protein